MIVVYLPLQMPWQFAMGNQPESLFYDIRLMRKHLAGCLDDNMMWHFISGEKNVRLLTKKVELIQIC